MYLPDFTWTHPYFTLKAAFLSNHCCFKKKKKSWPLGESPVPGQLLQPNRGVLSAVQLVALVGAVLWVPGGQGQGQMDTGHHPTATGTATASPAVPWMSPPCPSAPRTLSPALGTARGNSSELRGDLTALYNSLRGAVMRCGSLLA